MLDRFLPTPEMPGGLWAPPAAHLRSRKSPSPQDVPLWGGTAPMCEADTRGSGAAPPDGEDRLRFVGPGVWTLPLTYGVVVQLWWVNSNACHTV